MTEDLVLTKKRPPRAGLRTYKPNHAEEKYIRDGLAYLVIRQPFFAHLFYNECDLLYTREIPFAATDARSIFVNPDAMKAEGWGLHEVAFVLAHELGHVIFNDLIMAMKFRKDGYVWVGSRQLPYDAMLMNVAEDYRINAMLVHAGIGKMPSIGLYDPYISKAGMESAVEIYGKLWKPGGISNKPGNQPGNQPGCGGGGGQPGDMQGHGGFDIHLEPTKEQVKDDESGKRTQAIASAAEAARSSGQGTIPGCIQILIGEILEPTVPWQDKLRSTMMRHGGDPTYDWRYLDKRLMARSEPMYFARQAHMGAGCVVIGYDTSGSCVDPDVQRRFFSEMAGITADLNPQELIIIWCDASVQRVDELEEPEDLDDLHREINELGGAPGGGGTSFVPVFEEIEERGLQPDMLVYLTDTYGSFPKVEPDYPVIWASITKEPHVPWGEVVEVELEAN